MRMKRFMCLISCVLTALALAAVAGCGSGSSDPASVAAPLSKAEYVSQADAACERAQEAKARSVEKAYGSSVRADAALKHQLEMAIAEEVVPLYRKLVTELTQLKPPAKDEAQVNKLIVGWKAAMKTAESNPAPLIENDPFRAVNDAAMKYGIKQCIL